MKTSGGTGKKLLSVFMSAVMVAQLYASPVQTAYSQEAQAAAQEEVAQALNESLNNDSSTEGEDADAQSDETPVEETQTEAPAEETPAEEPAAEESAPEEGATDEEQANVEEKADESSDDQQPAENEAVVSDDTDEKDSADTKSTDTKSTDEKSTDEKSTDAKDEKKTEETLSEDESGIAVAAASGSYNPEAPYTAIDNNVVKSSSLKITYADGTEWKNEPIVANTTMNLTFDCEFVRDTVTLDKPNVSYAFPDGVNVTNHGKTTIYDSGSAKATWYIQDNVFYMTYDEAWLKSHPNDHTLTFNADFTIRDQEQGDGDSAKIVFPGTGTTTVIPFKDGGVTGGKWGTIDATNMTVSWTVDLDVKTAAHKVVLTDTIGSNLSFDNSTFEFDGNSVTPSSIDGQTATFSLGDLKQGKHTLTYTTKISDDAWKSVEDGNQLSGINNSASWTWGSDPDNNKGSTDVTPNGELKTNMATKSHKDPEGTSADVVTWTATLNSGSLKADMKGYTFTDTLSAGHKYTGDYVVYDAAGNKVASDKLNSSSNQFTYKFPSDLENGKQTYTIVYQTKLDSASSTTKVTNHVDVTPEGGKGPSGSADDGYIGPDDGKVYVTKELKSKTTEIVTDGYARWESVIKFSAFPSDVKPTSVTFTDEISADVYQRIIISDIVLKTSDGVTLIEGTDYVITNDNGQYNKLVLTFQDTSAVRSALSNKKDVTVSYRTTASQNVDGTYTNKSTVKVNDVTKDATASYTLGGDKVPAVNKSGKVEWDPNFDWSKVEAESTERGAWIASWTIAVNNDDHKLLDLKKEDVVVTDTLPDNMVYVPGSSYYYATSNTHWEGNAVATEPKVGTDGTLTYTVPTTGFDSTKVWVTVKYQTAAKASTVQGATPTQFTNKASAESGNYKFPEGSKTVEATNKVVEKGSAQVNGSANIRYTIKVNEYAAKLSSAGNTLTLVDTMDSKSTYVPASFHAYYHGTTTEVSDVSTYVENIAVDGGVAQKLTVTLPDATAIDVVYEVTPNGSKGDQVTLTNTCYLVGYEQQSAKDEKTWVIQQASADTQGSGNGITIYKYDGADSKKGLKGAKFQLYKVNMTTGEEELIDTQTSDDKGAVTFGTETNKLSSMQLYYFVETKAPDGYEITYTGKTYFILKGANSTSDYNKLVQECKDMLKKVFTIDVTPSAATSFNVPDKKSDLSGEFSIDVEKTVNGAKPAAGQTFDFTATSTDAGAPALSKVTTDENGKATFTGELSDSDLGKTYTYTIDETTNLGDGWIKAGSKTVTVKVEKNEAGTALVATVDYGADATAVKMNNTYVAKTTAAVEVKKAVNGGTADENGYKFGLFEAASGDVAWAKKSTTPLETITVKAGETGKFAEIEYTTPGVYRYIISETSQLGSGWSNSGDVYATVTVSKGDDGSLSAKVEYEKGVNTVVNTYKATGSATVKVSKTVNGSTTVQKDKEFTFGLYAAKQDGDKWVKASDDAIKTVTVKGDGVAVGFGAIDYTLDDAGKTFDYVISETSELGDGWTKAADQHVSVKVTDDGKGGLTTDVAYEKTGATSASFDNTYEAEGSATLSVHKTVEGASDAVKESKEFTFNLYEGEGTSGDHLGTVKVKGGETKSFDAIEYKLADAGKTYTYTIHEESTDDDGWTYASDVTATVEVKDNGDGNLVTTVSYDKDRTYTDAKTNAKAAQFTNKYDATGSATVEVSKTVNGKTDSGMKDQDFSFGLYAAAQNTEGKWVKASDDAIKTVNVKGDGVAVGFGAIDYTLDDAGKTFDYVISETSELGEGWTKAADQHVSVKVTDDGKGNLVATVAYEGGQSDAAAFDNTYTKSTSVNLEATKTLQGRDAENDEFTFTVTNEKNEVVATAKNVAAKDDVAAKVTFSAINYTEAGTYNYTIKETVGSNGQIVYDQTTYTATVKVTKADETGELSATVTYKDAEGNELVSGTVPSFTNKFSYDGVSADVKVSKKLSGADLADYVGKFQFELRDDSGESLYATTTNDANGIASFKPNFKAAGTYVYQIREVEPANNNTDMFYDASTYYVEIVVSGSYNGGTLKVESVKYYQSDKKTEIENVVFSNKKADAVSAQLKATKTVNGGNIAEGEKFTFQLYKGEDTKGEKVGDEKTADSKNPTVTFDGLSFTEPGEYKYTIHETSAAKSDKWKNADDVTATVTVTRDETNKKLVATVAYSNGTDAAVFNNTYTDSTSATISVNKKVVGATKANEGDTFDFDLYKAEGYFVAEDGTVSGTKVDSVSGVAADGTASFKSFEYGVANAGEVHNYVIHESSALKTGWTKAADVKVTVEVKAKNDRTLYTVVTYDHPNVEKAAGLFTNTYETSGEATLSVYKTVNDGVTAKAGEKFTFELYKAVEDESGNWVKDGEKLGTVETEAGKVASFDTLKLTKEGTTNYLITEVDHDGNGWTRADDVVATVVATDNGEGKLSTEVTYSNTKEDVAGFNNTYEATGNATVNVHKTVNAGKYAAEGEEFTFDLYGTDETGAKTGEPIDTVTVKAGDTATFDATKLAYTFDDVDKTFTYVVSEVGHDSDAWFSAPDVTVTVTVSDNGDGTLKADVAYDNGSDAAEFDDTYSTATATLGVYKTVNVAANAENENVHGGAIVGDEKFTFALLDEKGEQVGDAVTVDKDHQKVNFAELTYDAEGTYNYTIHETAEAGEGWENANDVTVTVEVSRDVTTKQLVSKVTYSTAAEDDIDLGWFDNAYKNVSDSGLKVSKTVTGGTEATADETFEFQLIDKDGEVVSTAEAKANETVPFKGVHFSTADAGKTFEYTVHEVGHNDNGWTADSDVKVTVKVSENEDRTLNVDATYSRGTDAAEFTNTYETTGEATISVYKTIDGQSDDLDFGDEEFTFTLVDPDGKTLELVETTVGQVASFKTLKITRPGTYVYTIHELGHNSNGWTADSDVKATVTATDNGKGQLDVKVEYDRTEGVHDAAWFDNKYEGVRDSTKKKQKPTDDTPEDVDGKKSKKTSSGNDNGGSDSTKSAKSSKSGKTPTTGDVAMTCAPLVAAGGLAILAANLHRSRKRDEE